MLPSGDGASATESRRGVRAQVPHRTLPSCLRAMQLRVGAPHGGVEGCQVVAFEWRQSDRHVTAGLGSRAPRSSAACDRTRHTDARSRATLRRSSPLPSSSTEFVAAEPGPACLPCGTGPRRSPPARAAARRRRHGPTGSLTDLKWSRSIGQTVAPPPFRRQPVGEPFAEPAPVRHAGQHVLVGQLADLVGEPGR